MTSQLLFIHMDYSLLIRRWGDVHLVLVWADWEGRLSATRGHCRIAYNPPALGWLWCFGSASLHQPVLSSLSLALLALALGFFLFPATPARRLPGVI